MLSQDLTPFPFSFPFEKMLIHPMEALNYSIKDKNGKNDGSTIKYNKEKI